MKKIIFGTLAAATLVASVSTASAQMRGERNWLELNAVDGGASYGYNQNIESFDSAK